MPSERADARDPSRSRGRESGFTLIELLIVVAIIGILSAIAIPNLKRAIVKAHTSYVAAEARQVHQAFQQFYRDNSMYPNASSDPAFNLRTFEPLRGQKYYTGVVVERLMGGRADAYDSPDDRGSNQEFWLEFTLEADPTIRFLVAESDNAPLGGGQWMGGIFMFKNGVLTDIDTRL